MKPYLDTGFLLTLLVRTNGSEEAIRTLSAFKPPFELNLIHQLQVELFLQTSAQKAGENLHTPSREASMNWYRYVKEDVFTIGEADWSSSFKVALHGIRSWKLQVPHLLLVLHPSIAFMQDFSHFLSFDPRSREVAAKAKLKVLPERL